MKKFLFTSVDHIIHSAGSPVSGGSFSISTPPDTKNKAAGSFVYTSPITVSFSGGNMAGMIPGSVNGTGTISATGTKVKKRGGTFILRHGDSGTLVGTAQPTGPGPPPTVPSSVACECSVTQVKTRGED